MALRFKNKEVFPLEGTNKFGYEVDDQWVYEINVADDANRIIDTTNWGIEIKLEWYETTVSMDLECHGIETRRRTGQAPPWQRISPSRQSPTPRADGR